MQAEDSWLFFFFFSETFPMVRFKPGKIKMAFKQHEFNISLYSASREKHISRDIFKGLSNHFKMNMTGSQY